ncbi:hypothetical protein BGZ68_009297 [Mortierella alpina]|nr:hypothetical protein BGZ68_009297 [Mortierella alpina]
MAIRIIAEIAGSNGSDPSIIDAKDYAGHRNLEKMRAFYTSCMNESQIENVGRQPLVAVIKEIIDLFPVRDSPFAVLQNLTALEDAGAVVMNRSSAIDKQALTRTIVYFSERGLDSLLSIGVVPNATEPSRNIIRIEPNTMGWISKQYYSIGRTSSRFYIAHWLYTHISHVLTREENGNTSFTAIKKATPPVGISDEWKDFVYDAFSFQYPVWFLDHPDKAPLLTTVKELEHKVKSIDWPLFLQMVFPSNSRRPTTMAIAKDVAQGFDDLLKARGSPLSVQAYFVWRAIEQLIRQISPTYALFLTSANDRELGREQYCARVVNSQLGMIAGHFFVKKTFSQPKMTVADKVAMYVREAFINTYRHQGWVNRTALLVGFPSINGTSVFIGHDASLDDDNQASVELETFYEDYKVDEHDFFGNRMRYAIWHRKNLFRDLDDPSFKNVLQRLPQNVVLHRNACGRVRVPLGLLQPPLFYEKGPEHANYATLGVMLAREYALEPSTNPLSRLELELARFKEKVPDESHFTQRLSQEEVLESFALQQAFQAWTYDKNNSKRAKRHPKLGHEDTALDRMLNKSYEQMFFISYANSLCEIRRNNSSSKRIPRENSTAHRAISLNGVLQTCENFAEAFNCSVDVPWNPPNKS